MPAAGDSGPGQQSWELAPQWENSATAEGFRRNNVPLGIGFGRSGRHAADEAQSPAARRNFYLGGMLLAS